MFNRLAAKEKSKTLLRTRIFTDIFAYGALLFCRLLLLTIPVVGFFTELLFQAGMVRSSLRMTRGDKNVKVLDIALAGDRLGRFIAITLWQALLLFLWTLPGIAVAFVGGYITVLGIGGTVVGALLILLAIAWNIYITLNKTCQYYFAYYVAEDNRELSALDCIRESSEMMIDHKWELFVTMLSFLGWNIISTIVLPLIFTLPYQYLTYASIYEQLSASFHAVSGNAMEWRSSGPVKEAPKADDGIVNKAENGGIEVLSGEYAGSRFTMTDNEEIRIGRDSRRADVVTDLVNKSISGLHCSIRYNAVHNRYTITDYSSNGTFVNNERLMRENSVTVTSGTVVKLADGSMIFRLI